MDFMRSAYGVSCLRLRGACFFHRIRSIGAPHAPFPREKRQAPITGPASFSSFLYELTLAYFCARKKQSGIALQTAFFYWWAITGSNC